METALTLTQTDRPRIYVACLAAYNNGYLHGAWIDADREPWAIWNDIMNMLARSPIPDAEEFAIHDDEGFGRVRIGESADIERVAAFATFIAEHGALGAALLAHYGDDLAEAQAALADRYYGNHPSLADYVQELTEDTVDVPDALRAYIDWEAMAEDAELSSELFTIPLANDAVHVFGGG